MRKFRQVLLSIEFVASFIVPIYLWVLGLTMFSLGVYSLLFSVEPVEIAALLHFGAPVTLGAAGLWGIILLYLNAAFSYKAFNNFLEPVICGCLGVFGLLYYIFAFNLTSPLIAILPIACFVHLAWLNKNAVKTNGT